jgi:hypothetical protein
MRHSGDERYQRAFESAPSNRAPFLDPALDQHNLGIRQRIGLLRHTIVLILDRDSAKEFALLRVPGDE